MREEQTERLRKQSNPVQFCSFQRTRTEMLALHCGMALVFLLHRQSRAPVAVPASGPWEVIVTVTTSAVFLRVGLVSLLGIPGHSHVVTRMNWIRWGSA